MDSADNNTIKWHPFIYGLLGGLVYISVSAILPDWNHTLTGIYAGVVYLAAYLPLPKKLDIRLRALIPIPVVLLIAAIIRIVS